MRDETIDHEIMDMTWIKAFYYKLYKMTEYAVMFKYS